MDQEIATRMFEAFLARKQDELGVALAQIPASSRRLSKGWAFFYQSRDFVDTGDFLSRLVGHGPIIIADDGRLIESGSLDRDPEALLLR